MEEIELTKEGFEHWLNNPYTIKVQNLFRTRKEVFLELLLDPDMNLEKKYTDDTMKGYIGACTDILNIELDDIE